MQQTNFLDIQTEHSPTSEGSEFGVKNVERNGKRGSDINKKR